jgi:uncharacterized membrane protein
MNAPATEPRPNPSRFKRELNWDDHRIEIILGIVLRTGVALSAVVVLWGALIYLGRHAHEAAEYRIFRGEPSEYRTIPGVIRGVIEGQGRAWVQLGLLLLIATPIARVVFSIAGFILERDRMYVVFTLIVLTVLLYSLLGSGLAF